MYYGPKFYQKCEYFDLKKSILLLFFLEKNSPSLVKILNVIEQDDAKLSNCVSWLLFAIKILLILSCCLINNAPRPASQVFLVENFIIAIGVYFLGFFIP